DIPIIFLSPINTHKKFVARGYIPGGIDYVPRPIDPDILLLKIKMLYRLSEQTRQLKVMERSLRDEIELRRRAQSVLEEKVKERTLCFGRTTQRLEESNNELQQFGFIASQDLQQPLRKIQTFSGLALDKVDDSDDHIKPYLGKRLESATRLRSL